jgi:hypothetical protein
MHEEHHQNKVTLYCHPYLYFPRSPLRCIGDKPHSRHVHSFDVDMVAQTKSCPHGELWSIVFDTIHPAQLALSGIRYARYVVANVFTENKH